MSGATTQIGLLFFPRLTQLDLTGPFEAFARLPNAAVHLWKSHEPVTSDVGLRSLPTAAFESCPSLNVLYVPGGPGVNELLEDDDVLTLLRREGDRVRYVTSAC